MDIGPHREALGSLRRQWEPEENVDKSLYRDFWGKGKARQDELVE